MDDQDPKIRDTAKMVWQLFKTLLPLKQAQYTANQLERVKQQEAQRAAGQHANGSTAGVSPAAAPAEGSTATAVESPKQQNEPEAEEEHVLDVSDFDRKELDQIFKTLKAHRGKIFTKPALFEEIMSFRGTRTEFLQRIEAEIGSNDGGSK
jgi:hypothetical protein